MMLHVQEVVLFFLANGILNRENTCYFTCIWARSRHFFVCSFLHNVTWRSWNLPGSARMLSFYKGSPIAGSFRYLGYWNKRHLPLHGDQRSTGKIMSSISFIMIYSFIMGFVHNAGSWSLL